MAGPDAPLRLGALISCPRRGRDDDAVFAEALALTLEAERLGYESVWFNEHHFIDYGRCPSPLTMAAFVLGRTTTIRVGTAVVLLALHDAVAIAEQAALIDRLSGGRLDLGVGRGAYARDLVAFGVAPADLDGRYEHNLQQLADALGAGQVRSSGEVAWDPPLPVAPAPQAPTPVPRYLATGSPDTASAAARLGYGLLLPYHAGLDRQAELVAAHGGTGHVAIALGQVADSLEEAIARVRAPAVAWLDGGLSTAGHAELRASALHRDRLATELSHTAGGSEAMADRMIAAGPVGTPEDCARWMRQLRARTGITRVTLFVDVATGGDAATENLRRFAQEVMPLARD